VNVKTRLDENQIQASRVASSDENGNRYVQWLRSDSGVAANREGGNMYKKKEKHRLALGVQRSCQS